MHQTELLELMKAFDSSGLSRLHWEHNGVKIELEKDSATVQAACMSSSTLQPSVITNTAAPPQPELPIPTNHAGIPVKAPLVGVLYCAPSPESEPFVTKGKQVKKGDVLCIIEAMKMMNELLSPIDGTIACIYAKNEEIVAFDQVLFEVVPC